MQPAPRSLMDELLDGPLVGGWLDDDFYKVTMGQFIHRFFPDSHVRFGLVNRSTNVRLADVIRTEDVDTLISAVLVRDPGRTDLHYLRGTNEYAERMFAEEYLRAITQLTPPTVDVRVLDGQYDITAEGLWSNVSLVEVPILAGLNELRNRTVLKRMSRMERDEVLATGIQRLGEKIRALRASPGITFSDFGTRRRGFRAWQRYVVTRLAEELPEKFLGTSNTELAKELDLLPMGTNAHELPMVMAALSSHTDDALCASPMQMLDLWWRLYGKGLSICLPDTFGSESIFRTMTAKQARDWKGFRHDSGDPGIFAERVIAFYESHSVDPREKLVVFSDGLNLRAILSLYQRFHRRINVTFGWGTLLTNDLGIAPISIVMKAIAASHDGDTWHDTCKLSDNPAKHLGSTHMVDRYKRVFQYGEHATQRCVV